MKKTGQLLKESREKQGISLNAVSAATKIGVKVLEAIESGDASELPPKTFVRGFVQTYAAFLKLDVKAVLDVFQEEVGTTRYNPVYDKTDDGGSAKAEATATASVDKGQGGIAKWLLAGLALLLFVAIYFVSQAVQKYKKESEIMNLPPEVKQESPLPIASPGAETAGPGGATTATTISTPAGSPPPSTSPAAPGALAVASPTPSLSPSPSPTAGPTPLPTPTPSPSPSPTPSPSPSPTPVPQDVTIEALDTVKIDYVIDDSPVQSLTLEPEKKKKFSAKKSFSADVSDGGAISIILNGKDKGVPGNLGQPLKLSFPPKE